MPNWDKFSTDLLIEVLNDPILSGSEEQKRKNIETREAFRESLRRRGVPENEIPKEPENDMRTIYKYRIGRENTNQIFKLTLPESASFLHFAVDPAQNDLYAWFQVDTERNTRETEYMICGTGCPLPEGKVIMFLGTCFDSPYVWHLFKVLHDVGF